MPSVHHNTATGGGVKVGEGQVDARVLGGLVHHGLLLLGQRLLRNVLLVEAPEAALPGLVGGPRELLEALVQRQVVSDRILHDSAHTKHASTQQTQ